MATSVSGDAVDGDRVAAFLKPGTAIDETMRNVATSEKLHSLPPNRYLPLFRCGQGILACGWMRTCA